MKDIIGPKGRFLAVKRDSEFEFVCKKCEKRYRLSAVDVLDNKAKHPECCGKKLSMNELKRAK